MESGAIMISAGPPGLDALTCALRGFAPLTPGYPFGGPFRGRLVGPPRRGAREMSVPEGRKLVAPGERSEPGEKGRHATSPEGPADGNIGDLGLPALRGSPDRYAPFRGFACGSPPATGSGPLPGPNVSLLLKVTGPARLAGPTASDHESPEGTTQLRSEP